MINILIKDLVRDRKFIRKYSEFQYTYVHSEIKFVRIVFTTAVNKKFILEVQSRVYFFFLLINNYNSFISMKNLN